MDDMTPPTTGKPAKKGKVKAVEREEVTLDQANAEAADTADAPKEAKPRKPRQDYGFVKGGVIQINREKEVSYRGQRKDWFDTLVEFEGQPVDAWSAHMEGRKNNKGTEQKPRGWLSFYMRDGSVTLSAPAETSEASSSAASEEQAA